MMSTLGLIRGPKTSPTKAKKENEEDVRIYACLKAVITFRIIIINIIFFVAE